MIEQRELKKSQEISRITNCNLKSKEDINTNNSFGFLSQAEIVETEKETYNPKDGEPGRVTNVSVLSDCHGRGLIKKNSGENGT